MKVKDPLSHVRKQDLVGRRVTISYPKYGDNGLYWQAASKGYVTKRTWTNYLILDMSNEHQRGTLKIPQEEVRFDKPRPDYTPPSQKPPKEESE